MTTTLPSLSKDQAAVVRWMRSQVKRQGAIPIYEEVAAHFEVSPTRARRWVLGALSRQPLNDLRALLQARARGPLPEPGDGASNYSTREAQRQLMRSKLEAGDRPQLVASELSEYMRALIRSYPITMRELAARVGMSLGQLKGFVCDGRDNNIGLRRLDQMFRLFWPDGFTIEDARCTSSAGYHASFRKAAEWLKQNGHAEAACALYEHELAKGGPR